MKLDHSVDWFYKYPADKFAVTFDFTNDLSGTSLSSCTASVYDSTGTDKTASLISSTSVSSPNVSFVIQEGTGGETYKIKLVGVSAASYKYTHFVNCEIFNSLSLNTKLGDSKQNSYVTLKEANDYIRNKYGHVNGWDTLNEEGKKRLLIESVNDLEVFNYNGEKYYEAQGLQFPRNDHDVITGACATPSTTTTFRNTSLYSSTYNKYPTDWWKYGTVHFNVGSNIRETRLIDKSNAVNGSISLASPVTYIPKTTDTFIAFVPLDKELKDAQIEQAMYIISNSGIGDLQNYMQLGAKRVSIGDVSVDFNAGGGRGTAISSKARALLSRFLRKGIRIGRA